ncbi:hypothetical protein EYF80_051502 [Liparis tanakae]|uniref:Uncharacterized protein n=1 Tax=Liparis tanakae TaxID=230148 RepID=A0A4Z2FBP4_9TELE|nr:hypothetical protein EYF80_051502 [Liparis tanakae]
MWRSGRREEQMIGFVGNLWRSGAATPPKERRAAGSTPSTGLASSSRLLISSPHLVSSSPGTTRTPPSPPQRRALGLHNIRQHASSPAERSSLFITRVGAVHVGHAALRHSPRHYNNQKGVASSPRLNVTFVGGITGRHFIRFKSSAHFLFLFLFLLCITVMMSQDFSHVLGYRTLLPSRGPASGIDFLAKFCIFSQETLAEYKRAFEAILELVDFRVADGLVDLRLFAVIASLAQKIAAME